MKLPENVRYISYVNKSGNPESIQFLEKTILKTPAGDLIPVYETEDHGRQKLSPVKLHHNGTIKSIALQQPSPVKTPLGSISAELITFYRTGTVRRIFPLNGRLSGFWTETNEYKLAEDIKIETPAGEITIKPLYIQFHESGKLKSIAFWPEERTEINSPAGKISVRRGVSFHENGVMASCEPENPLILQTPLGIIEAFNPDPNGISGDNNSLAFSENGEISGVATVNSEVTVSDNKGGSRTYQPEVAVSMCSDTAMIKKPLFIEFSGKTILFRHEFKVLGRAFISDKFCVKPFIAPEAALYSSCSL